MDRKHLPVVLGPLSLVLVAISWENPLTVFTGLTALGGIMLWSRRSRKDTAFFFLTGLAGATAEIIAVQQGAWAYRTPAILGVPYWLPVLWGIASVFVLSLHEALSEAMEYYRN